MTTSYCSSSQTNQRVGNGHHKWCPYAPDGERVVDVGNGHHKWCPYYPQRWNFFSLCIMHYAICIILLTLSCATKPDIPPQRMQIEHIITTHGNPIDFDISNNTIFVAEDQVGFSLFHKNGSQIYHQDQDEIGSYWTQVTLIRYFLPHNIILVYDRTNDDYFRVFAYDENNATVTQLPSSPASNTNNIRDLVLETTPINSNRFRAFYGFYGEATNRFNRAYFDIGITTTLASERYINVDNPIYNLTIQDDHIIAAMGPLGITIFDKNLDEKYTCLTLQNARAVKIKEITIYVADYAGLCMVDVSDITQPVLLPKTLTIDGRATCLDIDTTQKYLAVGSNNGGGLYLFDISNPTLPAQIAHFSKNTVGNTINKIMFHNDKLYVASREMGILSISYN